MVDLLAAYNETKYVVLHNSGGDLVMAPTSRDLLFATGNVIDVKECSTYSLQPEYFKGISRRPLTLVLINMADRYDVATQTGVTVFEVKDWSTAHLLCEHKRGKIETWTDDEGQEHSMDVWRTAWPEIEL